MDLQTPNLKIQRAFTYQWSCSKSALKKYT